MSGWRKIWNGIKYPGGACFWTAGEDHDIHEINHLYKIEKYRLQKSVFRQPLPNEKQPVSYISFQKRKMESWYKEIIASYGETKHTRSVLRLLKNKLESSETYTDFFVHIANHFFKQYGLLMIDSAHPQLRKIESSYFQLMIQKGEKITEQLINRQKMLSRKSYPLMIDSMDNSFQLFIEQNGARELLYFDENKRIIHGRGVVYTREELDRMAVAEPEKLSNNVVTRPLMQEMLFPTIAFIAGPGEITCGRS